MLTCRSYSNADSRRILDLWSHKTAERPEFFASLSMDILEGQILGNILFDPAGLIFAFDGDNAVGFIHASFCPDAQGEGPDTRTGILFSPIARAGAPNRDEILKKLIAAGETYLSSRGAQRWYAGGYANASPFYTGLYGRCNPDGIYGEEGAVLDAFLKGGYHPYGKSILLRLPLNDWHPPISPKAHEAFQRFVVRRIPGWTASNWWEANIYRNFSSAEWNVFARSDRARLPEPLAGLLIQRMQKDFYKFQRDKENIARLILSYVGVMEDHLRMGIGSFLFSSVVNEIRAEEYLPAVIETVVPESDRRLISFLKYQGFSETGTVHSFYRKR